MKESEDVDPSSSQHNNAESQQVTGQSKWDDLTQLLSVLATYDDAKKEQRASARAKFNLVPREEMTTRLWEYYNLSGATDELRYRSLLELRDLINSKGNPVISSWGTDRLIRFCDDLVDIIGNSTLWDGHRSSAKCIIAMLFYKNFIPHNAIPSILEKILLTRDLSENVSEWMSRDGVDAESWSLHAHEKPFEDIISKAKYNFIEPIIISMSKSLLKNVDWKRRHGGLWALGSLSNIQMRRWDTKETRLDIVMTIVPLLTDLHPRVRNCACNVLKHMSSERSPTLQQESHQIIVPALISTLSDPVPRIAAHAAAAIDEFMNFWLVDDETKQLVYTHHGALILATLERILQDKCQLLLVEKKTIILGQLIGSISTLSTFDLGSLIVYYGRLAGPLKFLLREGRHCQVLVGKIVECFSQMGEAVGPQIFSKDGHEVMRALVTLTGNDSFFDYPLTHKTFYFDLGGIAILLGAEFAQYVPSLMSAIIGATERSYRHEKNACRLTFDKDRSCIMLILYFSQNFGGEVIGFIPPILKLARLHRSRVNDYRPTSRWAYAILPIFIDCLKLKGDVTAIRSIWKEFLEISVEACKVKGGSVDHLFLLNAFTKCMHQVGREGLTDYDMDEVRKMLKELLERVDNGASDECFKSMKDGVSKVLVGISKAFHGAMEVTGVSLMTGDDLLMLINLLLPLISHDIPVIRRNCAYGIGVLASCRVPQLVPVATHALDGLCSVITRGDARSTEKAIPATENALTAIARILGNYGETIGEEKYNQVFSLFIDSLSLHAITNDKGESEHIYGFIVDVYQKKRGFIPDQHVKFLRSFILSLHYDSFKSTPPSLLVKSRVCAAIKQTKESDEHSFKAVVDQTGFTVSEMETLNKIIS